MAKSGQHLIVKKKGEAQVKLINDGKKIDITICDVLLAPELELNLLSVRKLEMRVFTIVFETGKVFLKKMSKGVKILLLHKGIKSIIS